MGNEEGSFAGISKKSYIDDSKFKISLGIGHEVEDRLYAREIIDLLKTEQEKFNDLKTCLVTYERDLQFYKLLILVVKVLKSDDLTITSSKQSSVINALMKSVVTLFKGKEVLFNNTFVKKFINYEVMRIIEFVTQKEEIYKTTAERVLQVKESNYVAINVANKKDTMLMGIRDGITQEEFDQYRQEIDSEEFANFMKLIETCVEVQSEREKIDLLKEKCIPDMKEILSCGDHVNYKLIAGLMQKLGKISRIDMVYVRSLVKYLVLGTNIQNTTLTLLLDKVKDPLRSMLLGIKEHFVDSEQDGQSRNSRKREKEEYKKIAVAAEPFLTMMLPTKEICDICQEICDTLDIHFQKINKEIELLLCKTCTRANYEIVKQRVLKYICSDMKSAYSFMEEDCDVSACLDSGVDRAKLSDLCFQRDVVLDRMCQISQLSCSAKEFPNIVCDFLTDDYINYEQALLKCRNALKRMYHIHYSMKLGEPISNTIDMLKEPVSYVNNICQELAQDLSLLGQKDSVVYNRPTTNVAGPVGSKGMCCFCLCNSAIYVK
ncbi:hypothetical protein [Ehrlichia ruminantium]|uniref:Uncharacterized protein n=1 Tax=Ehrlichia ruminantium (strain Welgevonden) TaxID=254945 RepID=A0A0H3M1R1_EHRRW|nr:hypothetical protein [Ehrlichia ruminantium]QLK55387.1 hypothetical protein FDZ62_03965 [Ehrlichia ruminantium]QLK56303.1 hypothetical protein FDZ61_03960 [Ehrlichia ruminantium]UOD99503.1 hypothetical protein IMW62_03925 [Ehrlichia ruminantium]CAH58438.1 hypothetical protein Erum7060 [Ehrlichia ruminantium str. Welgevonden]CAI27235.1 Hypothetical protein ERWE_CDS_07410 [Ehrlichia ruminantium str. Welgevonden]